MHVARRLREEQEIHLLRNGQVQVIGITLTDNAVNISDDLSRQHSVSDITHFSVGDYHDLQSKFQTKSCNVVVMTNSLCHSKTPQKVLLEAHRCLHDDGLLFVKDLYSTIEPMEEEQEGYGGKEWEEQGKELRATQLALLQQFSLNFKMAYHTAYALIRLIEACGFECQFVALEEDKDFNKLTIPQTSFTV